MAAIWIPMHEGLTLRRMKPPTPTPSLQVVLVVGSRLEAAASRTPYLPPAERRLTLEIEGWGGAQRGGGGSPAAAAL